MIGVVEMIISQMDIKDCQMKFMVDLSLNKKNHAIHFDLFDAFETAHNI